MRNRKFNQALAGLLFAAASFIASAQSFSNTTAIPLPDLVNTSSTVNVSGLTGDVADVQVSLHGFSHTWLADLNVLLVSPAGAKIILMGRVNTSGDFQNAEVVFSAAAATTIPFLSVVPSGTYLPTLSNVQDSPPPAPVGPYSTDLSTLNGAAATANGTWTLYITDFAGADAGQITGGWTLDFDTTPAVTCASEGYTGTKLEWCKNICERGYTGGTLAMWIRRWTDRYRTLPYCALAPQPE